MKLKNKIVVITGASRGLGRVLAIKLAKEGANIALVARTEKDLSKVKSKIGAKQSEYFVCDVTSSDQIKRTVKEIVKHFGNIDILVNNAGVWYEGPSENHPSDKLEAMFDVNILALINFTKNVIPIMKNNYSGQIFNVASRAGVQPFGSWGPYAATKYAVRGYTDSLKEELSGTGIKVHGFYSGGINTGLFESAGFKKKDSQVLMEKRRYRRHYCIYPYTARRCFDASC